MSSSVSQTNFLEVAQRVADEEWPKFKETFGHLLPPGITLPERFIIPGAPAPSPKIPGTVQALNLGEQLLGKAMQQRGRPYQWGGTGNPSFDCSGLTQWAARGVGINIGRTTYQQIQDGVEIPFDQVAIGDLVFSRWSDVNTPEHVSIWAGNGKVFEAGDPIGFYNWGDRGFTRVRRVT